MRTLMKNTTRNRADHSYLIKSFYFFFRNSRIHFPAAFLLLNLFLFSQVHAQTLISPTGDGGFETGTTFAANGWSVVNPPSNTNRNWYCGTGQAGYTGNRAAFIGNNETTVGTNAQARTIHLYRSISIPAGATNIQLSFKYKQAVADYSAGTFYDYIRVYLSTGAPANGSQPTGTLLFGSFPTANVTTFTTQTATINNSFAGTTQNLIFTFTCDAATPNGYGAIDDVSLTYTPAVACSGTPTPGTASPATQNVTAGNTATISLTGYTAASGLTFQWQESATSGGTYTNVTGGSGATTFSYTTPAFTDAVKYYRCIVSCGAASATSSVAEVVRVYCTPSGTNVNTYFTNFTTTGGVSNIANTSVYTSGGYANYTALSASQYAGSAINYSMTINTSSVGIAMWVDWNNDGDLVDAGEQIYNSGAYVSAPSGSFTIPSGQAAGNYRLRILADYNALSPVPCTITGGTRGEAEDYTLTVLSLTNCAGTPNAGTAAISSSAGCSGINFTLSATGLSTGSGITYQWQSSPDGTGSWTNVASATSNSLTTSSASMIYYRIQTTCSISSQTNVSNVVSYSAVPCYNMPASGSTSLSICSGMIYDPGGTSNYSNSTNSILTIFPSTPGNVVTISFNTFDLETGYDGLLIYNGNSTSAPLVSSGMSGGGATTCPEGSFFGTTLPPTYTSTAADGSITLRFLSDASATFAGFTALVSCSPTPSYSSSWISMSTGLSNWCAGEVRNVSVTVRNSGTTAWTNGSPDINIGVKWSSDASYTIKADANGLAAGATQTFSFPVTAPSTMGYNKLMFDVINEGNCIFSANSGTCGPGNVAYTSGAQYVKATPAANAGSDVSANCAAVQINGVSATTNVTLLKEDFESSTMGIFDGSTISGWTDLYFTGGGYSFWAINGICPLVGSKSLTLADLLSGTDCDYDELASLQIGIAYDLPINAVNFTNLKLNFKWKGTGQTNQDYAQVMYSFNGTNWTMLPTQYNGQSTLQTVSNLDLSVLNGQQFYIGFYWRNNGNTAGTAFVVDDIQLTGDVLPAYSWSPTSNLSATNIANPMASPPSTTTYTLTASYDGCSSQDPVDVIVNNTSVAPTSVSGGSIICPGNAVTLTANGGTLPTGAVYEWFSGSCGATAAGTGASITVSPSATTTYYARVSAVGTCAATACANGTVTLPATGTTLSNDNESATCVVQENNFIHFYHSSGRLLASINSNGQNLGNVSVTSYLEGGPLAVPSCVAPYTATSVLGRHWVITPQFQPSTPVILRLPFDNASEFGALFTAANGNSNTLDDVTDISSLKLSKYSGPVNVDNVASNNCVSAGGSGGTTLHTQTGNGDVSTYVSGFNGNGKYIEFSVPGFSEFWLHGNSTSSPLPVTLTNFSASCNDGINLSWTTASESNSQKFVVERSRDLNTWEYAGETAAAGNSNYKQTYLLEDQTPFGGVSYYRLLQIDNDGASKIYGPISVSCAGSLNSMTVFPNPSKGNFTVEILSNKNIAQAEVQLTDMAGKTIAVQNTVIHEGNNQLPFNGTNLHAGPYMISILHQSEFKPIMIVIE